MVRFAVKVQSACVNLDKLRGSWVSCVAGMKLPNANHAIVPREKIADYLRNV